MDKTHSLIVTIVRHGQTQGNVNHKMDGVTDTPLNDTGRRQSENAAEWLKNEKFDFVFTSNLKRASETASIIVAKNLSIKNQESKFIELEMLRERNMGIYEGVSYTEYNEAVEKDGCARHEHLPKEGESIADVRNRCIEFMKKISGISPASIKDVPRILVVAHGFVLAQMIGLIYEETKCPGMNVDDVQNMYTKKNDGLRLLSSMPNTGITKVEIEVEENSLKMKSSKCHLYKSGDHLN
jgi:broad specificity phosphatase PhoE